MKAKISSANDPAFRACERQIQALQQAVAALRVTGVDTALIESRDENAAAAFVLLQHRRHGDDGYEGLRFTNRTVWRLTRQIIKRATAEDMAEGEEDE